MQEAIMVGILMKKNSKPRDVIVWGGLGEKLSNKGTQWYIQNRIYNSDGLCPALTTYKSDYWVCVRYEED